MKNIVNGAFDALTRSYGGDFARQRQCPDDLYAQPGRRFKVHPPGFGGQIDYQTAGPQIGQGLLTQNPGRDGVDDEVIAAQPTLQLPGVLYTITEGLDPGQIDIFAGCDADARTESGEPVSQQLTEPPIANYQRPGPVEGDG